MEKKKLKLKKILIFIPILIISLSFKNVYAEDLDIYRIRQYSNYQWTNPSTYETKDFTFKVYDNTFKVNYNIKYNVNNVLYDKQHDLYFIIILQVHLPNNTYINCTDGLNILVLVIIIMNGLVQVLIIILQLYQKKDETDFWKTLYSNRTPVVDEKDGFYLTQVDLSGWSNVINYISNNPDNFDLIYSSTEKSLYT